MEFKILNDLAIELYEGGGISIFCYKCRGYHHYAITKVGVEGVELTFKYGCSQNSDEWPEELEDKQ